jgi:phosphoribosylformimino-5-aminoimidazole carboxamide ribotide isomerase
MDILPAIDLRGGRCVRLEQGRADRETVYGADPAAVAEGFARAGATWLHVVDLDGAFEGAPRNLDAVRGIAAAVPHLRIEFGGGLRTEAAVEAAAAAGAHRLVLGTRAATDPAFVEACVRALGADRIAVGIDARDGLVVVRGWVESTPLRATELAARLEGVGVRTLITTDVATDGMLSGPNLVALEAMLAASRCDLVASGGIASLEDVRALAALAQRKPRLVGAITGKALYEGRLDLAAAVAATRVNPGG